MSSLWNDVKLRAQQHRSAKQIVSIQVTQSIPVFERIGL